ncbi:ATP-dependent peptidase [Rickenella mellea]|uniref:ATP-dependent peptidase n=1 Tax=Rickenella mellea TaxID=50990 RepID=A0A4Y7QJ98_9AGAM|nr:ATP-dependent peptidase [Rickenella mellea]
MLGKLFGFRSARILLSSQPPTRLCAQAGRSHGPYTPHFASSSILIRRQFLITLPKTPKILPSPSPQAVAEISALEAAADAEPRNVESQVKLLRHLVSTQTKTGYKLVMNRWERMCQFDPASPLLRSDEAFELYLTALAKSGHEASITHAAHRRDTLLSGNGVSEDVSPSLDAHRIEVPPSPTPSLTAELPESPPNLVSRSRILAQSILSKTFKTAQPSTGTPESSPVGAAVAGSGVGVSGNPIHVTLSEPRGATFMRFVRFIVLTFVGSFFILVLLAVLLENSGLLKVNRKASEFEPMQSKPVKFSDVLGVDEAKEELQEVVEFLKNPATFANLGGKLPKGILLTGRPGTGKTMLARAVAGEAGVPFFFASGSEFDEMFVGVGAKRVRELFAAARKKQPAIIFIDELDAMGGKRSSRDAHYMKQTLNQLLVEMDGFQQSEGIIVIAATNFPESLDPALVRPGRFDNTIAVPLPDVRGRVQIVRHYMKDVTSSPEVDPMIIARGTAGFSGADLQNMVNQAAIKASRDGKKEITLKDLEWAKDRILMGAERTSHYIDPKVKKMTAYHEGGHALVALYTEGAMPLHKVTCVTRGHSLGLTQFLPDDDQVSVSLKEYLASIAVSMGGRAAEDLIYGEENVTSGCMSDLKNATKQATNLVRLFGYSRKIGPVHYQYDDDLSTAKREEIESETQRILVDGYNRAKTLLDEKKDELHRLAEALVEHETLDLAQVRRVIKGEPIESVEESLSKLTSESESPPPVLEPQSEGSTAGEGEQAEVAAS